MCFIIIPRKFNDQKFEKVVIFLKNKEQKSFVFMNFVFPQQSQITTSILIWLYNSFIVVSCIFHYTHFIYLPHILQRQSREKLFKVIHLNNQSWNLTEINLSSTYFDMSLEGSIKENIDELIYEAIETIRGKKAQNFKWILRLQLLKCRHR